MVQRWAQELIRYRLTVIHQSEKIMGDVDAITRQSGDFFSVHLCVAKILRHKDELKRPDSYDDESFVTKGPTQLNIFNEDIFVPVITVQCIQNMSQPANIAPTTPPPKSLYIYLVTPH